jgi:hypothetical protein
MAWGATVSINPDFLVENDGEGLQRYGARIKRRLDTRR